MSVPRCRLLLCVAEQLCNDRKTLIECQCARGERVARIVDPYVVQAGALAKSLSGGLKVAEMSS